MGNFSQYLLLLIFLLLLTGEAVAVATTSDHDKQTLTPESDKSERESCRRERTVTFADPILEQAIREQLNIHSTKPLTQEKLSQITSLEIVRQNLSSLDGIEYLTSLEKLVGSIPFWQL